MRKFEFTAWFLFFKSLYAYSTGATLCQQARFQQWKETLLLQQVQSGVLGCLHSWAGKTLTNHLISTLWFLLGEFVPGWSYRVGSISPVGGGGCSGLLLLFFSITILYNAVFLRNMGYKRFTVYTHTHTHTHTHRDRHTHTHTYIHRNTHTHTHTRTHTHTHTHTHAHTHTHTLSLSVSLFFPLRLSLSVCLPTHPLSHLICWSVLYECTQLVLKIASNNIYIAQLEVSIFRHVVCWDGWPEEAGCEALRYSACTIVRETSNFPVQSVTLRCMELTGPHRTW